LYANTTYIIVSTSYYLINVSAANFNTTRSTFC